MRYIPLSFTDNIAVPPLYVALATCAIPSLDLVRVIVLITVNNGRSESRAALRSSPR